VKHVSGRGHGARHPRSGGRTAVLALLALLFAVIAPALVANAQEPEVPAEPVEETIGEGDGETDPAPETTVPDEAEGTTTTVVVPEPVEEPPAVEPEVKNITIVQTPDPVQGPCQPIPASALSNYVLSNPEVFRLRIVLSAPLCEPLEAVAVIYAMPGNGESWPQTLVERLPFTLLEAGTTDVTFTKTCDPVQFDVLTGATPEVIAPLGEWHGPLLFPFDTNTSLQHWGCTEVLPVTIEPEVQPVQLALTGSTSATTATAGGAMLLAGALMLLAARRRTA
jgi:LPXTG-motif cell wall-anchored protein